MWVGESFCEQLASPLGFVFVEQRSLRAILCLGGDCLIARHESRGVEAIHYGDVTTLTNRSLCTRCHGRIPAAFSGRGWGAGSADLSRRRGSGHRERPRVVEQVVSRSVLTAEEIERSGARTVEQAIRLLPACRFGAVPRGSP